MGGGRMIASFTIVLLWFSASAAYGFIPGENCSRTSCVSILDAGQALQQPSSHIDAILNRPILTCIIFNNPPKTPLVPLGIESGISGINYDYSTSAVDPDGDRVRYQFDWGDGSTIIVSPVNSGTVAGANHNWTKGGIYKIKARAIDCKGSSSRWSESLNVTIDAPPGKPSTPSGPSSGRIGIAMTYSVSALDPDGDQINYTFDWDDGTTSIVGPVDSGVYAIANHTWTKDGAHRVKAAAMDSKGIASGWSDHRTVMINAPPNPPLALSGPISVYAWAPNSYSALVTDPDKDSIKCIFDWGDGNRSITGLIPSGSTVSANHSWSDKGYYGISVFAVDSSGDSSAWSENLTIDVISNGKPGVPINLFGPSSGYTGAAYSYFTLADDPDKDNVSYTFEWGDGTLNATDIVDSGSVESTTHSWTKAGTYQVRCNAIDSKGAPSMWSKPLNITIDENDPPTIPIIPSGPTSGHSLMTYNYATSATDPEEDNVRYVIDWGDGTTSWTGVDFIDSGSTESLGHKWSNKGKFQVRAMAMDDKGAFSKWSNALLVDIS